jgi:hypothetical protein
MNRERLRGWVWLPLAGLGLLIYRPTLNAFFVADDFGLLYGVHKDGVLGVWSLPPNDFFRPLISLSLFLDYQCWGFKPFGFHLMNLLIHLLNSLLVYRVARALGFQWELSMWAGAFFMVMTCHVEAAAWVSGRTDLIATCFCLLCLEFYIRSRMQESRRLLIPAYGAFILGLMAKETAIIMPLLFIAYEWWRERGRQTSRPFIRNLMPSGIALLILMAYLFVRMSVVGSLIGGYGASQHLKTELLPTLLNIGMHFFKTLLPASLSDALSGGVYVFLMPGIGLGLSLIVIYFFLPFSRPPAFPSSRPLLFLMLAFFLSVLPTATLKLPLMMAFNDRFIYLPSVWVVLGLCWCLSKIGDVPRSVIAGGLIMLYRVGPWQSTVNWAKAGQLTQSYLLSLKEVDSKRSLLFLSVPDSYRSAYIFRNGLPEAIGLFVPHLQGQEIVILSKFTKRMNADTTMEAVNESPGEFRLMDPRDDFLPPERAPILKQPIPYELSAKRLFLPVQHALDNYTLLIPDANRFRERPFTTETQRTQR